MKKETVADKIRIEMTKATRWMAVSDLAALIPCSTSAIRRNLHKTEFTGVFTQGVYQSRLISGDQHGRKQWALVAADTTNWNNAAPIKSLPRPKKSKKQQAKTPTGSPVGVSQQATYGGLILMCAPANKPSLIKAVGDLLINEFVTGSKKFSAFDVTKRLRGLILSEAKGLGTPILLDPNELGTVFVQGLKVCKVEHDDVKATIHDIFNAGGMPNLSRMRDATDKYWEYGPAASLLNVTVGSDSQSGVTGSTEDPDPISGGTMGSTYDGSSTI